MSTLSSICHTPYRRAETVMQQMQRHAFLITHKLHHIGRWDSIASKDKTLCLFFCFFRIEPYIPQIQRTLLLLATRHDEAEQNRPCCLGSSLKKPSGKSNHFPFLIFLLDSPPGKDDLSNTKGKGRNTVDATVTIGRAMSIICYALYYWDFDWVSDMRRVKQNLL